MKRIDPYRLLKAIEGLCLARDGASCLKQNDLDNIYMIAHLGSKTCKNDHSDWLTDFWVIEKKLKKGGMI